MLGVLGFGVQVQIGVKVVLGLGFCIVDGVFGWVSSTNRSTWQRA